MVDDSQADALLTGLVKNYSPSREEQPAVQYLVDAMAGMDFNAYADSAGNAVGEMGCGANTLILLGHIDTVPGNIPVRSEGDLLYGRGTVDAKGPLATFVSAVARTGELPGWRVIVVGAVEEESATSKGARHILATNHPDAVIIGEPSQWDRVTIGYKGRLLIDYVLSREIGHTAGPDVGVCEDAFNFWHATSLFAQAFNTHNERIFDQLSPSLRSMHSESDGFTQKAALSIGFRIPPDMDAAALQHALQELAGDAGLSFHGYEIAFRAHKNTILARAFIKAIQAEGSRLQFIVKSGTSDMNVVGPVWQCPIVAYGPGDSTLDHTPDEHIDLREYHKAIQVLSRVLQTLSDS